MIETVSKLYNLQTNIYIHGVLSLVINKETSLHALREERNLEGS